MLRLARATYAEMALAGITIVGEFHYLHHGPGGVPYADPNEMGRALVAAAAEAGIRIVLLDACYLRRRQRAVSRRERRGVGASACRALDDARRRGDPQRPRGRPGERRASSPPGRPSAARRCTRTSPSSRPRTRRRARRTARADGAPRRGRRAEPSASRRSTRRTRRRRDIALLGGAGATVCLCPTTERDLADGIGPARALADAGARLALGSDSHAVIDLLEEARARRARRAPGLAASAGATAPAELLRRGDGGRLREPRRRRRRADRARRARRPHDDRAGLRRASPACRRAARVVLRDRRRRARTSWSAGAGSSATARTSSIDVAARSCARRWRG